MNRRYLIQKAVSLVLLAAALISSIFLIVIFSFIFIGSLPSLNIDYIIKPESISGHINTAIGNAIAGTILISLFSTAIATPLAIGTAIYMVKYAPRNSRLVQTVRLFIEVLSGTPSIVLGIFGFMLFVVYMKQVTGGYSLLSGAIALGILILPVIERAAEDAIERVPGEIEEGSYALGASKWFTIRNITLPIALSGIITGIILGFGRAAEESAVVLFTAGYSQFFPEFDIRSNSELFFGLKVYPFQDLVGTLPLAVYNAYNYSNLVPISNGFATAFVLICIVLLINLTAKTLFWYSTRTTRSPSPFLSSLARTLSGGNGRFSRQKPVPLPACAATEVAGAERDAQIRRAQGTASPPEVTPSPLPTTSEIDWRRTLTQGLRVDPEPAGEVLTASGGFPAGADRDDPFPDQPAAPLPLDEELFEDEPGLLLPETSGVEADPALAGCEVAGGGEPALMEEQPARRVAEQPDDGNWRRMEKNRLENTIVGMTGNPWEWP